MTKPWLVTCVEIPLKPACVFAPIVVKGTRVSVAYMMRQPEGVDKLRCLVKVKTRDQIIRFSFVTQSIF
jgi:hypothetical protein